MKEMIVGKDPITIDKTSGVPQGAITVSSTGKIQSVSTPPPVVPSLSIDMDAEDVPFPTNPSKEVVEDAANMASEVENIAKKLEERDTKITEATWIELEYSEGGYSYPGVGKKWEAFSKTWDETWFTSIMDDYKYNYPYEDIEDEEFKKSWDNNTIWQTIEDENLQPSDYERLSQANNNEHKKQLIRWIKEVQVRREFVDETLNSYGGMMTENTVSHVATGFIDVDLPIVMVGGGITKSAKAYLTASKAKNIRYLMMGSAAGAHTASMYLAQQASDGEMTKSEALFFGLLGISVDSYAIYKTGSKAKKNKDLGNKGDQEDISKDLPTDKELEDGTTRHKEVDDAVPEVDELELRQLEKDTKELEELEAIEEADSARLQELSEKYDTRPNAKQTMTKEELEEFDKLNTESMNRGERIFELKKKLKGEDEGTPKPDINPRDKNLDDMEFEDVVTAINNHLLPFENKTHSYTVYNIAEEQKLAKKYGKGSAKYNAGLKKLAYGKYQILGSNFRNIAKKTGKSEEWLRTPDGQEFTHRYMIKETIGMMKKHGVDVTPRNYYVYHQLGHVTAKKILKGGKFTAADIKRLVINLPVSIRKIVGNDINKIVNAWTKRYLKREMPYGRKTTKQAARDLDTDIDNLNLRRKQHESIPDKKTRRNLFKKTDAEMKKLIKERNKITKKLDQEDFAKKRKMHQESDYKSMADDFKANKLEYDNVIRQAFKTGDKDTIKEIDNVITELYDQGFLSKGDYEHFKNMLKEGKYAPPELRVNQNKDGSYSMDVNKNGKSTKKGQKNYKKKVAVAGALGIAMTGEAMAGDGEAGGWVLGMAGIGLLGIGLANKSLLSSGYRNLASKAKKIDRTVVSRANLSQAISKLRTSITETLEPLKKDPNKDFVEFMKKLLWDAENGDNLTIERNAGAIYHGLSALLHKGSDLGYQKWLKEQGVSRFKAAVSNLVFNEMNMRMKFEIKVFENIEQGKHMDSPAVKEAAKNVKDTLDKLKKEMKDSGMKGAEEMFDIDNYMPRYFRSEQISQSWHTMNKANKKLFVNKFAKMFVGKDGNIEKARIKAEAYIEMMIEMGDSRKNFTDTASIQKFLDEKGIVGFDADEFAEALNIGTSQSGRTKTRIRIDKTKFETIVVKDINGNTLTFELNDIFVNNSIEAVDRLLKSQSGHIAFADAGFKSIDEAIAIARKGLPENAKIAEDVIKVILGQPIVDLSDNAVRVIQNIQNYTTAITMPFSVISLTQEAFVTMVNYKGGAWKDISRELVNIFKKHGESSALVNELMSFIGQGQHKYSTSYGTFAHIGEGIANKAEGGIKGAAINKMGQIARDTVLYNLGLVPVSDFLQRINLIDSANYLYDIVNNNKKLTEQLRTAIGLTPEIEEILKKHLIKVDGELQALNIDTWARADQLAFKKVIDNMMQKRIQMVTNGGTPNWARTNTAGILFSQLLKFSLQAFSNHGIYNLKGLTVHKDPRAMAAMGAWFAGGYVSALLRSEIKGQDLSDDELFQRAWLSMPILGAPDGLYRMATEGPAAVSAMSRFSNTAQDAGRIILDN